MFCGPYFRFSSFYPIGPLLVPKSCLCTPSCGCRREASCRSNLKQWRPICYFGKALSCGSNRPPAGRFLLEGQPTLNYRKALSCALLRILFCITATPLCPAHPHLPRIAPLCPSPLYYALLYIALVGCSVIWVLGWLFGWFGWVLGS